MDVKLTAPAAFFRDRAMARASASDNPANEYHQEYWNVEGQRNPYCLAVIPPKLAKLRKGYAERLR